MNAIERLRFAVESTEARGEKLYPRGDYRAERVMHDDALAAVDALYQAAKDSYPPDCEDEGCLHPSCALARAVRRVEGQA